MSNLEDENLALRNRLDAHTIFLQSRDKEINEMKERSIKAEVNINYLEEQRLAQIKTIKFMQERMDYLEHKINELVTPK